MINLPIEWIACGLGGLVVGFLIAGIFFAIRNKNNMQAETILSPLRVELDRLKQVSDQQSRALRSELADNLRGFQETTLTAFRTLGDGLGNQVRDFSGRLDAGIQKQAVAASEQKSEIINSFNRFSGNLTETLNLIGSQQKERLQNIGLGLDAMSEKQGKAQENLKNTVETRLDVLRAENAKKLEEMRITVDEKLQGTLEKRLGESFQLVSGQLEQVFKSMGEMQSLATGVGDLKKVLTGVKTRGTLGEQFLHDLLAQMLAPNQYGSNIEIKPNSGQRVEFAIRMPGSGEQDNIPLWLPVDSKFPTEDYNRLVEASERNDLEALAAASKALEARIKNAAKDIHDKYIAPPHSTDFAILFLPTEALFAEITRRVGFVEGLQREYKVGLAGPTTLMATLNSLRMGFRTLAIQKSSSEAWRVLSAVKTEFGKYGSLMKKVQKKLQEAQNSISDVHKSQRAIDRSLHDVGTLSDSDTLNVLKITVKNEHDSDYELSEKDQEMDDVA